MLCIFILKIRQIRFAGGGGAQFRDITFDLLQASLNGCNILLNIGGLGGIEYDAQLGWRLRIKVGGGGDFGHFDLPILYIRHV